LVVAVEVDGELAEDLAGGGVDDGDLEVVGQELDVGPGAGSSDTDVAEPACEAQGHGDGADPG